MRQVLCQPPIVLNDNGFGHCSPWLTSVCRGHRLYLPTMKVANKGQLTLLQKLGFWYPDPRACFRNGILQGKEPGLLGKMPDSRDGTGKIQDKPEVFCSYRKVNQCSEDKRMGPLKEHRRPLDRDKSWKSLSDRINNVVLKYNSKCKIRSHRSILIKINTRISTEMGKETSLLCRRIPRVCVHIRHPGDRAYPSPLKGARLSISPPKSK